jgi:hypothetical protein
MLLKTIPCATNFKYEKGRETQKNRTACFAGAKISQTPRNAGIRIANTSLTCAAPKARPRLTKKTSENLLHIRKYVHLWADKPKKRWFSGFL